MGYIEDGSAKLDVGIICAQKDTEMHRVDAGEDRYGPRLQMEDVRAIFSNELWNQIVYSYVSTVQKGLKLPHSNKKALYEESCTEGENSE